MNSTTTVQAQLPHAADILRKPSATVCGTAPHLPDASLKAYLRELARVGDHECFFHSMGRLHAEGGA